MGLKWFLNSAYTLVSGHSVYNPPSPKETQSQEETMKRSENMKDMVGQVEFQMPLHYPRYTKADYEKMDEWKVDLVLGQYGLTFKGMTLDDKRAFCIGAFLWPQQL